MRSGGGGRRGLLAGVVLGGLVVGAGGGWALAEVTRPAPVPTSSRPLAASNPDAPATLEPSSDLPPLGTDLDYVDDRVGSAGTTWELQRPADWERKRVDRGIRWVLPGDPDWTYSVRVVPTGSTTSTSRQADNRLDDLRQAAAQGNLGDVELVDLTDDAVMVTYVQEGHLKYQRTQFVAGGDSATAVFEVSTSGRIEDRDGLDALAEHMAASVHRA